MTMSIAPNQQLPARPLTWKQRASCWIAQVTGRARLHLRKENLSPVFIVGSRVEARKVCALDDEEELLTRFLDALEPGDVVYDIGGNMGLYAIPSALKLARLGPGRNRTTGEVLSFEPVAEWSRRLRDNARENGVHNLRVFEVALSDRDGRASFTIKDMPGSGMGSLMDGYGQHMPAEVQRSIEVEVARGNEYAARHELPQPNVVKIDVEGAEENTLSGLDSLLGSPDCRFVLVEVHTRFARNHEAITGLLEKHGYSVDRGPLRGFEYHLFASRPGA